MATIDPCAAARASCSGFVGCVTAMAAGRIGCSTGRNKTKNSGAVAASRDSYSTVYRGVESTGKCGVSAMRKVSDWGVFCRLLFSNVDMWRSGASNVESTSTVHRMRDGGLVPTPVDSKKVR